MLEPYDASQKPDKRESGGSVSGQGEGVVALLKSGQSVISETRGHSMEPLLREGRTKVLIRPIEHSPEPGDILLWWRWDDVLILHRLLSEDEERYYLRGDNCAKTNRARKDRVIGVVTDIYRNGRWFPVTNKRYQTYVRLWMGTAPMRMSLHRISTKAKGSKNRSS